MASGLPDYVASAKPVPQENRMPWFKSTAQTYAGIMLWFVFWQDVPVGQNINPAAGEFSAFAGGTLSQGLGVALFGLILAALICHFLFYLVPGMLGLKTGLPLYIVGTSTYGVNGGFLMPGFLMGVLQFGWLAVNAYFSAMLLAGTFGLAANSPAHLAIGVIWAVVAAFVGLKGIQYVAKVATFLPLIPLVILAVLLVATIGGIGSFDPQAAVQAGASKVVELETGTLQAGPALSTLGVIGVICAYVVGFFATAGAAGCDFGMNNRDAKDVQLGGLVGIALATIVAGGVSLIAVAGAQGLGKAGGDLAVLRTSMLMGPILTPQVAKIFMFLLAIAAFPPACFSSLIAANSFKTTLPKVNPFITCGLGTAGSIALVVSGYAGDAAGVFTIIGASFGPVCGAMAADYLLAGKKWAGPRAGFNPAGWISWIIGFAVGAFNFIPGKPFVMPCPPVAAFIVGFVLYLLLAKAGMESRVLEMPTGDAAPKPAAE
ncbi:MAG: cytosine permease [Planctomycetaceae bacterium]|nr:cytosine permease [Planctomycetaceae bacterium]